MKYYIVTAKCGHVGRDYYIPIDFPIRAESRTEAAKIARNMPRVKHHHKDAILGCREVLFEEYKVVCEKNKTDAYLLCHSSSEQKLLCDIEERKIREIKHEPQSNRDDKIHYLLKKRKIAERDYLYQYKYAINRWEGGVVL